MEFNENRNVDDEKVNAKKSEDQHDNKADEHGDGHSHDGGDHSHAGENAHASEGHDDGHHEEWSIESALSYHLSPDHLIGHVQDAEYFEWFGFKEDDHGHLHKNKIEIPKLSPYTLDQPLIGENGTISISGINKENQFIGPATFQPTKFVILQLIGALVVCAIFIPYARRVRNGEPPKGWFWNMIDAMVCFVKDEIAVPSIGSSDAKRFLPFVWTIFFFVLALNLIGMIPSLGAATGSISVTAALALAVFFVVVGTGVKKMGFVGFLKAQAPHLDVNPALKMILLPMIWAIEMFGLMIKHIVLAVRLFANMFAGHLVVGVFVAFIGVTWGFSLGYGVTPMVILASIAINLLELLVAFIQAYVFAFLTSLFIGTAIHPH